MTFFRRPLYYLALIAIFSLAVYFYSEKIEYAASVSSVELRGTVDSQVKVSKWSYKNRRANFVLKNGNKKILVYIHAVSWVPEYGDELELKGRLVPSKGRRNPGGFNQREFLLIRGIRDILFVKGDADYRLIPKKPDFFVRSLRRLHDVRTSLNDAFREYLLPNEAGFLSALIFGERSGIDQEMKDHFTKTGTVHLLAVSGFNVGFVIFGMWIIVRLLRLPKDAARIVLLLSVWFYCLLVGWQTPVLRAAIMASLFLIASLAGRKSDALNTLGGAALVILAVNPRQVTDLGFQLSFAAVWAMTLFVPVFMPETQLLPNERLSISEKIRGYFSELFWVSFVCLVTSLPLTVQAFYTVTPLAVLTNMVVIPLTFALFCLGIFYLLTCWWIPEICAAVISLIVKITIGILTFLERLPGSYVIVGKLAPWAWVLLAAGLIWFLTDKRIINRVVRMAVISLFCVSIFLVHGIARDMGRSFSFTMLDVGQGDALFFQFPNGNLLMDAGKGSEGSDQGRYVIAPFLKEKGINQIDTFVISHPQEDHIGGALSLFKEFRVKNILLMSQPYDSHVYKNLLHAAVQEKSRMWTVFKGSQVEGYPDAVIRVLHPEKNSHYKNINDASVVLEVRYGGKTFLLTGDIQEQAIKKLLESFLGHADVLKVPHHGARLREAGKEWVEKLHSSIALISVGENNRYGHPHAETLKVLESARSTRTYRSDVSGAVELHLKNGDLQVNTAA